MSIIKTLLWVVLLGGGLFAAVQLGGRNCAT